MALEENSVVMVRLILNLLFSRWLYHSLCLQLWPSSY